MILFIERELFPLDDSELNCGCKYSNKIVFSVFNSLKEGLKIKDITSATNVPETTIRNWKFGYSNLFKTNKKLDDKLKKETLELLKDGCSIPYISKKLKVNYDEIRLFLKKELDDYTYSTIKASDRKLQNDSKILTSDLSYIFKKLANSACPCSVRIDSGWNCTPSTASCLWRTPMISLSSWLQAVTSRQSGRLSRSITSE